MFTSCICVPVFEFQHKNLSEEDLPELHVRIDNYMLFPTQKTWEELINYVFFAPNKEEIIGGWGGITNENFFRLYYVGLLGREPDFDGLAFWTENTEFGLMSREDVFQSFIASDEYHKIISGLKLIPK